MRRSCAALAVALALVMSGARAEPSGDDPDAIHSLLMDRFSTPQETLVVAPVVVADDYAVAGWSDGDRGGRALLRRSSAGWQLVLCAGDALASEDGLASVGLPPSLAPRMAEAVRAAEAREDPARVALFSRFDGIMTMDGDP